MTAKRNTGFFIRALFNTATILSLQSAALEPYAELSATSTNLIVTESARISLTVCVPGHEIKELDENHPPFMPKRPPHVNAPFVSEEWTSPAVEKGDVNEMLNKNGRRQLGFSLNNFVSDPFESMMNRNPFESMFDRDPFESLGPKKKIFPAEHTVEKKDGETVWRFTLDFPPFKAIAPGKAKIEDVTVVLPLIDKLVRDRYNRPRVSLKEILLKTEPLEIVVSEPPEENRPSSYCGAIGSNVTAKASLDANVCTAGDPMMLTLSIDGVANPSGVVSPHFENLPANGFFRLDESSVKTDTASASRKFTWRMRVMKAGTIEFPPLEVGVYDLTERAYKILKTEAIPVQVKAGAQIALKLDEENLDGEIPFPMPDGIDLNDDGWKKTPMLPRLGISTILFVLPPFAFLFLRFAPNAIRSARTKRKERLVANAFAKCKKTLKRTANPERKDKAVREFLSVRYGVNAASVTALDAKTLMKNDFSEEDVRLAVSAIEEADLSRYSSGKGIVRALPLLATLAFLTASLFADAPNRTEFSWQRANSIAVNATDEEGFLRAAKAYGEAIRNGAENPVAYRNYGACLLMAGKAPKAQAAFQKAELYNGETPSLRRDLKAARARIANDPRAELSLMRIFFKPHFAFSLDSRLFALSVSWALVWMVLLLPKGSFKRFAVILTVSFLVLLAASVSASLLEERLTEEVANVLP